MAKNLRVHELAKELGLTNKEAVDLCLNMGIDIKGHSSSIIEAQADRVRRRAEREGLVRNVQPEEVKPVKKAAVKKVAAKKEGDAESDEPKPAKKAAAKKAPAKKAAAKKVDDTASVVVEAKEIRETLAEVVATIVAGIRQALESTPPELAGDIVSTGLTLAGGGALLKGLDKKISEDLKLAVTVAQNPAQAVVEGAGKCLENPELYKNIIER